MEKEEEEMDLTRPPPPEAGEEALAVRLTEEVCVRARLRRLASVRSEPFRFICKIKMCCLQNSGGLFKRSKLGKDSTC